MTYSFTCSCGDTATAEAATREEAVAKLKTEWTPEVVEAHLKEKHPGQSMTMEQVHAGIEQGLEPKS